MAKKNKFPWDGKIDNHCQIGGIETSVIDDGPGRGNRIAWVNTGAGLRFKVVIDRAMDIVDAFYNEHSLAWVSHGGITAPRPDANSGLEWLYGFAGGLVTTCGLTHIGGPEDDVLMNRGLHDRAQQLGQLDGRPELARHVQQGPEVLDLLLPIVGRHHVLPTSDHAVPIVSKAGNQ